MRSGVRWRGLTARLFAAQALVVFAGALMLAKGVALRVRPGGAGTWVLGDPDRPREILDNLLDNALRHTPSGGEVEVGVVPGPGIPQTGDGGRTVATGAPPGTGMGRAGWRG